MNFTRHINGHHRAGTILVLFGTDSVGPRCGTAASGASPCQTLPGHVLALNGSPPARRHLILINDVCSGFSQDALNNDDAVNRIPMAVIQNGHRVLQGRCRETQTRAPGVLMHSTDEMFRDVNPVRVARVGEW